MIRLTTPTLVVTLPDIDFDYCILTLSSDDTCVQVNRKILPSEVIDNQTEITLTQKETSRFKVGSKVLAQVNFMDGKTRMATNILQLKVTRNLYSKEIAYATV